MKKMNKTSKLPLGPPVVECSKAVRMQTWLPGRLGSSTGSGDMMQWLSTRRSLCLYAATFQAAAVAAVSS